MGALAGTHAMRLRRGHAKHSVSCNHPWVELCSPQIADTPGLNAAAPVHRPRAPESVPGGLPEGSAWRGLH
eukprot:13595222-Alexandrium_andersonii.AAC.1